MSAGENKKEQKRIFWLYGFAAIFFVVIILRLFVLQIYKGQAYRETLDARLSLSTQLPAPRGEILDRYGRPLVTNRTGYFVVLEKQNRTEKERNDSVLNLVQVLKKTEGAQEYFDSLPISFSLPFSFLKTASGQETDAFLQKNGFSKEETAQAVIDKLCARYKIDEGYTPAEKRILAGVRYGMEQEGFSVSSPYTFMEDVSIELVSIIRENASLFPDVSIMERYVREYCYPGLASHVLGRVGKISSEEYADKKEDGYKRNDYLGKQGVEKAFEQYLRGTDGVKAATVEIDGKDMQFAKSSSPIAGNTVMLTLDLDLQKEMEEALASAVSEIQKGNKTEYGGASVAIDVSSGEILAAASYPTYDITKFQKEYEALANDKAKPMFHRAFAGLYEPGSTFKPVTAIAAIDSGVLGAEETMHTKGEYPYLDHTFRCHIFRTKQQTHGIIDIKEALGVSCNYFFYEAGRRTGIEKIVETAEKFGLGSPTGVELSGEEAKGKLASPENRKNSGGTWYPGDVLQAAIGQSDNLFSPLQLANYAATLANSGINYKVRLCKAVLSGTDRRMLSTPSAEIRHTVGASKEALDAVKDGMINVTTKGGTAYSVFADFGVPVAGKTGSAQVKDGTNGLFICYAPAEKPQIAVSVVLEHGDSGTKAAQVAKDILKAYFEKPEKTNDENTEELPYTILP